MPMVDVDVPTFDPADMTASMDAHVSPRGGAGRLNLVSALKTAVALLPKLWVSVWVQPAVRLGVPPELFTVITNFATITSLVVDHVVPLPPREALMVKM